MPFQKDMKACKIYYRIFVMMTTNYLYLQKKIENSFKPGFDITGS